MFNADQILFFSTALILFFCLINIIAVVRKQGGWVAGETFWLWGLVFLSIAYLGYALGLVIGLPSLMVANAAFFLAYACLAFQLRFWDSRRLNIPIWFIFVAISYVVLFELFRFTLPYIARASFAHFVIWCLTVYLLVMVTRLYRKTGSTQMLYLGFTFLVESFCAAARLIVFWFAQETFPDPANLLKEPQYLIVLRWVWLVGTAMSYLTLMTITLEKTLSRNEELQALLKEKYQLLTAVTKTSRNRSASEMASTLSHELAQPLTGLSLATKQLKFDVRDKKYEELDSLADFLDKEAERSVNIIAQIDSLFRAKQLQTQALNISLPIEAALDFLDKRIKSSNVIVSKRGRFDSMVMGEMTQLEAVFVNLISNAITALSGRSGPRLIEIDCVLRTHFCVIEIVDNGPGIDPVLIQNLGSLYISDRAEGNGIGLWLSKMIVNQHGGLLEISNRSSGGVMARVQLPIYLVE